MRKNCFKYPVEIADDVFGESSVLADLIAGSGEKTAGVFLVADKSVVQHTEGLGTKIGRYFQSHGLCLVGQPIVMASGEKIKADNLQSVLTIVSALLEYKLGCDDYVMILGGGALLDVAGYAAAQVRGGVKILRVPTTPAAMMDAAFADYAAVDSTNVKDALRVPCQPAAVVIDKTLAQSVMDGVWCSGLGEPLRQAIGTDAAFMKKLLKLSDAYCARDEGAFDEIVRGTLASRAKKGPSSLALWSAARLEAMSGYRLPHGSAVLIGICLEIGYSLKKGLMPPDQYEQAFALLKKLGVADAIRHSQHLLSNKDSLLFGLDARALSTGSMEIDVCAGFGKTAAEPNPDRETIRQVAQDLLSLPLDG